MAARKSMSLEAVLEEERREVEKIIMQKQSGRGPPSSRSESPFMSHRSPVRSMLDIGDSAPRVNSTQPTIRSMLDIGDSPTSPTHGTAQSPASTFNVGMASSPSSTRTSPILSTHRPPVPYSASSMSHHRSMSDAATNPASFGPRSSFSQSHNDPAANYKFAGIISTNVGQAHPGKRASQPGLRSGETKRGSDRSNPDFTNMALPKDTKMLSKGPQGNKSKSPQSRKPIRSNSPGGSLRPGSSRIPAPVNTILADDGHVIDMTTAYRKLSDTNLMYGGSSLADYNRNKVAESDGNGRILKSNLAPCGDVLSSDDSDDEGNTSDEERRGRKLTTRAQEQGTQGEPARLPKSLLAAAEDERLAIASQPHYRSEFDPPPLNVTSSTGDKGKAEEKKKSKHAVQPATSYDQEPISGSQTPLDLELESDVSAIKQAQNMQLSSTPILSNPEVHRSIRIIYRGEFNKIQKGSEDDHRRMRKYLVATDLSEESTHALEWAIGTVLRDGDTLLAIYCMDEEASGVMDASNMVPDEPRSMREQAAAIHTMTKSTKPPSSPSPFNLSRPMASPLSRSAEFGSNAPSPAPSARGRTRLEEERERAVQDITERVSKLLRKTQLQVRVIVEAIHCRNPKHLITEVIDFVEPTLVVLGSRGRSNLKGTLLGSFSNYLVTKSSVPVMVARKRLRKKSKYQPPPLKQVNNLANPLARSLEKARID